MLGWTADLLPPEDLEHLSPFAAAQITESSLWGRIRRGGPQDASQHLVVAERLVLFGGVAGATIRYIGIRETQHPEAVGRQDDVRLLGMEDGTGRSTGLHLERSEQRFEECLSFSLSGFTDHCRIFSFSFSI